MVWGGPTVGQAVSLYEVLGTNRRENEHQVTGTKGVREALGWGGGDHPDSRLGDPVLRSRAWAGGGILLFVHLKERKNRL